ncbi:MAG: D-alanyl-D-alanine carboxypeptidase (penicillin-binding protein 5/6) [Verrucomicrobiales bacterium]
MIRQYHLSIGLAACLCLGPWFAQAEAPRAIPKLFAKAAVAIDAKTGTFLYQKNAGDKRAVASTQKLLTALVISEAGGFETMVKVEATDTRVEPSKVGIKTGREYPKGLLFQALLVKSGNDVARCLARDHSGGQDNFRPVLNAKARQLGMGDSNFMNAHGLTVDDQYSTARDMAKLAFMAYRNEDIRQAVMLKELEFPKKDRVDKFENTNQLLQRYPFVTGMKTGFTNTAGRCLISSGSFDGSEVIAVVLGSDEKHVWDDSESLLRWGLRVPDEPVEEEAQDTEAGSDSSS